MIVYKLTVLKLHLIFFFHLRGQVETVATTLSLGEQNHAAELKRVCLEFVSRNLGAVMQSEGYQHMIRSCPQLQACALPPARLISSWGRAK